MAKNNIQAILFDKDGTLLDFNRTWLPPYRAAANCIAAKSSGRFSADDILAHGGFITDSQSWKPDSVLAAGSNRQILESWNNLLGFCLNQQECTEVLQLFKISADQYIPIRQSLRRCLEQLKREGYALGIATMDDERQAHSMARGLGIEDLFDFICGADSGHGVKPEPGMINAFATSIGVATELVAMVGDSPRDIHMGFNAGAGLSIGVLTGAHNAEELHKHTPHVLADISELHAFLEHQAAEFS
ncbi:MAG: HAD family hydrolase [Gammaproteobacteria bacterium]